MRLRPSAALAAPVEETSAWSDTRLIRECLAGNDDAWPALIDKYKRLIYSIPMRQGATPEDAADIFQAVCLELFAQLPKLRREESLAAWLIQVTAHKHYQWRKQRDRHPYAPEESDAPQAADEAALPDDLVAQVQQEQAVRDAVRSLPARCRELIRLLFYEHPARPYQEIARRLGLAVGSIGFIRGRCLAKLERTLHDRGFLA